MIFIDTNYFLRFLLADIPIQHQKAKLTLREAASGKILLFTSAVVIFETHWVLLSAYNKNKEQVVTALDNILRMTFINFEHYSLLKQAVSIYGESTLGFVDVFNLLYSKSKGAKDFKTFDLKLSKKFTSL